MRKKLAKPFTLVELLVVIAIISILAGMLMPALESAINAAHQVKCASNMKQINLAFMDYSTDFDDWRPVNYLNGTGKTWNNSFISLHYLEDKYIYQCAAYEDFDLSNRNTTNQYVDDNHIGVGINMQRLWDGVLNNSSYSQYQAYLKITNEIKPSQYILAGETNSLFYMRTYNPANPQGGERPAMRHMEGGVMLFCDGHAKWMLAYEVDGSVMPYYMNQY